VLELTNKFILDEVTTTGGLESLYPEWAELWRSCPGATPFHSPDWLVPLWRHLGEGELWVISLRLDERLIAVAPFFIHERKNPPRRELMLLGTGITDYLDVLIEPGFEQIGAEAIFAHLYDHQKRWDVLDFQQLRPGSSMLEFTASSELACQVEVQEVCPVLSLKCGNEGLARVIPSHMLHKLQYYRRRMGREGQWRIEEAQLHNFEEIFGSFTCLHRARWHARGLEGVLAREPLLAFHREAAERLLLAGALRLYALRLKAQTIGALYSFTDRARAYFYLSGFDPEFSALSPGTLLIGHAIEEAIGAGAVEFDFLRGREAYKYMWGAKGRLNYRRRMRIARSQPDASERREQVV
jgi:CelD/BcsL family acetyltransferase involved in cellulose biosynthesis